MTVGDFNKPFEEILKKHITETEEMIKGYEIELQRAREKKDEKLVKFCEFYLAIYKNTREKLKQEYDV